MIQRKMARCDQGARMQENKTGKFKILEFQELKKMAANWIPFDNDMYADLVHTLTTLNDDKYALKPPGNNWTLQRKNSLREGKIFFKTISY